MGIDHGHRSYDLCIPMRGKGPANRFSMDGLLEPAEEDSFLWSLADLMTLLLLFFVLLYANTLPQSKAAIERPDPLPEITEPSPPPQLFFLPENVEEEINVEKADAEPIAEPNEPTGSIVAQPVHSEPFDAEKQEKIKALEENFSTDFYVRWEEKEPVFVLGEKISFNVGDATLLKGSQTALERIIEIVLPMENYQVIVSGHTDDVAICTPVFPSNWELSAARAASVAKFLASQGIDPKRLVIQGKAEFHPLVANTSAESRRINRRVEISLLRTE
jgi:chemotaxis protein MotB